MAATTETSPSHEQSAYERLREEYVAERSRLEIVEAFHDEVAALRVLHRDAPKRDLVVAVWEAYQAEDRCDLTVHRAMMAELSDLNLD